MKKYITAIPTIAALLLPIAASAHAHASYLIGGTQYDIVIGSLNEPVAVDDKTGLDLRITSGGRMQHSEDGDMEPVGGTPATGLEGDLKLELIAGDKNMVQDLAPAWGAPGSYKTAFYLTVPTTVTYRLFGSINGTPVDLSFTCRSEGEEATEEGEKEISEGVKQLMKGGGFGCPSPREMLGFPEATASGVDMKSDIDAAKMRGTIGIALSAMALVLAIALRRRR